jgi:hypothetical protein
MILVVQTIERIAFMMVNLAAHAAISPDQFHSP